VGDAVTEADGTVRSPHEQRHESDGEERADLHHSAPRCRRRPDAANNCLQRLRIGQAIAHPFKVFGRTVQRKGCWSSSSVSSRPKLSGIRPQRPFMTLTLTGCGAVCMASADGDLGPWPPSGPA
jgi:hypothetical protein